MEANLQATAELLDTWINSGECLGGQIFVSHEGEVVADLAMGSSGIGRSASVSDMPRLFCAVKPLTACCLARAAEEGEISFDDLACRYVPEFVGDGRSEVTLRQLLSHTSGLPGYYGDPYKTAFADLVRIAATRQLPGWTWYKEVRYNDLLAWVILAAAVERIYAAGLTEVVDRVILNPAGISDLCLVLTDPARYAATYVRRGTFAAVPDAPESTLFSTVNPAHGGFGSARGLGLFYQELIDCVHGTGKILSAEYAEEISTTHGVIDFGMGLGNRSAGLGFLTDVRSDAVGGEWSGDSFGHAGYVGKYRVVHAFADAKYRVAVAVRLFSVGAKNNWRFHRLGAAIWSDLGLV